MSDPIDPDEFDKKFTELYSKILRVPGAEGETKDMAKDMTDEELDAEIKRRVRKLGLKEKEE